MSGPTDLATIRRYLDALFELQKIDPVWASEVIRALADPLEQVHDYLRPIIQQPLEALTPEERRWRRLVSTKTDSTQ